jgi:hypothetical protein
VPPTDGSGPAGRGIWVAWSFAFLGGLAVIAAVMLALYHPCLQDERALGSQGCELVSPGLVVALTGLGTVSAVTGGVIATALMLRRTRP